MQFLNIAVASQDRQIKVLLSTAAPYTLSPTEMHGGPILASPNE